LKVGGRNNWPGDSAAGYNGVWRGWGSKILGWVTSWSGNPREQLVSPLTF